MVVQILTIAVVLGLANAIVNAQYTPDPRQPYSPSLGNPFIGNFKNQAEIRNRNTLQSQQEYPLDNAFSGDHKDEIDHRNRNFNRGQYPMEGVGTMPFFNYAAGPINPFNSFINKISGYKTFFGKPILPMVGGYNPYNTGYYPNVPQYMYPYQSMSYSKFSPKYW